MAPKYESLGEFLKSQSKDVLWLSVGEIETLVGSLPAEARTPQFWANASRYHLSRRNQWLKNGYSAFFERNTDRVRFMRDKLGDAFGELTSSSLNVGSVYTREQLRAKFNVTDATINTGVFHPKETRSVWLFITIEKTSDRTQYRDQLHGNLLLWQGQTSGRTDHQIIDHKANGLEVLVFLRQRKYEFDQAGFRYLGPFEYVSHSGSRPASFQLRKVDDRGDPISADEADHTAFGPEGIKDARERIFRTIAQRRGQQRFRDDLLAAYEGRCAVTDCDVKDVLEAAHIIPYMGIDTNVVANGLLLRSDIHTLFDCGLIAVDPESMTILIASALHDCAYADLAGRQLRLPEDRRHRPSHKALMWQLDRAQVNRQ